MYVAEWWHVLVRGLDFNQPEGKDANWFIDDRLEEFNEHMDKTFSSSYLGTMDESGPPWHGNEAEGNIGACPHITICKRKPESFCAQFNDAGCAKSNVLNYLEFEKAAKYHKDAPLMDTVGTYNAAMTVRCAEPWAWKNGVIYGDSRFGSVKAAYYLMLLKGVHSIFDIKTGTALYPRKELQRICPKEHGSIVVMATSIALPGDGTVLKLYAIAQRRGPSVHTFLSTCGTFKPEVPARFSNITKLSNAPWTTPAVLNIVTAAQPMIDKFNRVVGDQLGMHDAFVVRSFETRLSQHFLLPTTYVNAINAAKYFLPHLYTKDMRSKKLLLELSFDMVRNKGWLEVLAGGPKSGPGGGGGTRSGYNYTASSPTRWRQVQINGGPPSRESPSKHVLIPIKQLEGYKGPKQQRCRVCNKACSWACARCSDKCHIVALHPAVCQGSKQRFGCLAAHRANPAGSYEAMHEECTGTSRTSKRRRRINVEYVGL